MPTATQASSPAGSSPQGGQLDHLAHLNRMSRTAGLGSSEYTAVNVAAVTAMVVGAMSALSLISPIFLIVPLAGVIVAVIAIRQIRGSGGTQTGLVLAIIGLAACVGFAATTGYQKIRQDQQAAQDRAQIDQLVTDFGSTVAAQKYADALKLADPRWRDQVSEKRLADFFRELTAAFGPIKGLNPTGLYDIQEDPETHMRVAIGMLMLNADPKRPIRTEARFRNQDGTWKLLAMPEWFPPPAPGKSTSPVGPAGPPAP